MKKIIGITGAALLVFAFAVGGFLAYHHWAAPAYAGPDQSLITTEKALATPEMVLLASLDTEYLRVLDVKLNGTPRLPDLVAPGAKSSSVLQDVQETLLKQYDVLNYAAMAVYLTKENGPEIVVVSGGNLRQDQALSFLQKYPRARPAPGLQNAWIVQNEDPETCALSKEWTIVIDNNRVIATDSRDTRIIERLKASAEASRDVTRWHEFRKDRFAAAVFYVPESVPSVETEPLTHALASKAQAGLADFNAVYLGASEVTFPAKSNITLWLSAKGSAIAKEKETSWKAALSASRRSWQETLPALAALHDRARIASNGDLVLAEVTFDRELSGQLKELAGEFIGLLLSGFNTKLMTQQSPGEPVKEMIDQKPQQFTEVVVQDDVKAYDPKETFAREADATSGPFGISISAVRETKSEPRVIELELSAKGTHLPNILNGADDVGALFVNSVKDRSGKELMRAERCGPDRNNRPAKVHKMGGFPVVEAAKTVRLEETARLENIGRIEGVVRLQLPTRVEAIAFSPPKPGDHFDRDKTRVVIMRVGRNNIAYRVSGDTKRLLLMRAKNAKGQVLSSAGGSKTNFLGGPVSASQEFYGDAAIVEFVVALSMEEKSFPFTLENALPHVADQNLNLRSEPVPFARYSQKELKADLAKQITVQRYSKPISSINGGPVVIDLMYMQSLRGTGPTLDVYLPRIKNLEDTLTAIDVQIDALKLSDGKQEQPPKGSRWHSFVPMNGYNNYPYLKGSARIGTEVKELSPASVQSVVGHVSINIAENVKTATVKGNLLGQSQNSPCGPVVVSEIGRVRMTLEGTGNAGCVYSVRAFTSGKQQLFISNQSIHETEKGWELSFGTSGVPDGIEIIAASKAHKRSYPFTLKTDTPATERMKAEAH